MTAPMLLSVLPQLSDALAALVRSAAPLLCAIRIGPNRHVTGLLWRPDLVVTSDQALPAQDSYTIVLPPSASLASARAARRDPATNIASLQLDVPTASAPLRAAAEPAVGALTVVLGADLDGSPIARLSMIRRISPAGPLGSMIALDLPAGSAESGFALDARGDLLGMLTLGPGGEALVTPHAGIARVLDPLSMAGMMGGMTGNRVARSAVGGRPWLGVALQPINLPEALRPIAGQGSGRMVVSVTPNGPADQAGVRLGDVLLAIDGHSVSGTHGLRSVLGSDRIGGPVEIRLMREWCRAELQRAGRRPSMNRRPDV